MNRILSRISGPLLLGSILALGVMAWPGQASAEAQFFFRGSGGLLPMQVAAVPEEDEQLPPPGQAFVRLTYGAGWVFECESNWSAADIGRYRGLLETQSDGTTDPDTGTIVYTGTTDANGFAAGDLAGLFGYVFRGQHSTFAFDYHDDGSVTLQRKPMLAGDPRDWPADHATGPSPCIYGGTAEMTNVGEAPASHFVEFEDAQIVYR